MLIDARYLSSSSYRPDENEGVSESEVYAFRKDDSLKTLQNIREFLSNTENLERVDKPFVQLAHNVYMLLKESNLGRDAAFKSNIFFQGANGWNPRTYLDDMKSTSSEIENLLQTKRQQLNVDKSY